MSERVSLIIKGKLKFVGAWFPASTMSSFLLYSLGLAWKRKLSNGLYLITMENFHKWETKKLRNSAHVVHATTLASSLKRLQSNYTVVWFSLYYSVLQVMPLVTFVKWNSGACSAPSGETGSCLHSNECQLRGGIAGGQCAGGKCFIFNFLCAKIMKNNF